MNEALPMNKIPVYDPYPVLTDAQKKWFMNIVEKMVTKPDEANVLRVKGGNDLELAIVVAKEDEHLFTREVCLALKIRVKHITGVLSPVVYLDSNPHPQAKESIEAARSGV